jgi:ABC-type oligopeptide transport system ATPase subunit
MEADQMTPKLEPPVIEVIGLTKSFPKNAKGFGSTSGRFTAVDNVSLAIGRNEVIGLVGESGSGKTTLGRCILRLIEPDSGTIRINLAGGIHEVLSDLTQDQMRVYRRHLQVIFQDPFHSLNPAHSVWEIVGEGLIIEGKLNRSEIHEKVASMLRLVGLDQDHLHRLPNEFSGGQRQRLAIARALIVDPKFVVCDEVTSALDTRTQKQVLDLLRKIREERGISLLFISHDLQTVASVSDTVLVMRRGRIVERGPPTTLFTNPGHTYTQTLIDAIPNPDPRKRSFRGPR